MSIAISIDGSQENIKNLLDVKRILKIIANDSKAKAILIDPEKYNYSRERIDALAEWIDDMHKILTDYTLFSAMGIDTNEGASNV